MAPLTTAQRNALPDSTFAGPDRSYPIPDKSHAANALSRASQNASPALKAKISAKVHAKFPNMGKQKSANAHAKTAFKKHLAMSGK